MGKNGSTGRKEFNSKSKVVWPDHMMAALRTPKAILILAFIAFGVSLKFPFIALDDAKHIWQNPYVMNFSLGSLKHLWAAPYYGLYIPVVYSTWGALAGVTQALGMKHEITIIQAPLFHFLCVLFHLLNVWMLWRLFTFWLTRVSSQEESGQIGAFATLATLPFALHPLQAEAVAWASGLKDTFSSFFCLLALMGFSAYFFPSRESKRKKWEEPAWTMPKWVLRHSGKLWFTGCAAAFLSKPNTIVLPVAAAILIFFLNRGALKKSWNWIWLPTVAAVLLVVITKSVQPDARLEFHLEVWQRPFVALASLGFYLLKFLVPYPLFSDYGLTPDRIIASSMTPQFFTLAGLILIGLAVALKRGYTSLSIGLLLFGLGLGPVLGLVPFEFQNLSTVADRYFYLFPAIGMGWVLVYFAKEFPKISVEKYVLVLAAIWLPLSVVQVLNWQDNDRLFRHTTTHNPRSYLAWNNIGLTEVRAGQFDAAIEHFNKALDAKPDYLAAISNLGVVYFKKGDFPKTIEHYQTYLAKFPPARPGSPATFSDMHFNLGAAQVNMRQLIEAEKNLRLAIAINPDHFMAHFHLGRVLGALGNHEGARQELLQAYRLNPQDPAVQSELRKLGP